MIPAVSQVCSLATTLPDDLAECKLPGMEIWLPKLETFVDQHTVDDAQQLLAESAARPVAASYQGGLWEVDPATRQTAWKLFERRLELCRQVGIDLMIVAADTQYEPTTDNAAKWQGELAAAGDLAAKYQMRLAVEFQARASLGNNLLSLAAILAPLQHPALGICWDAFHAYVGPSQTEDWQAVPLDFIRHVQLCDLSQRPRELAKDRDRILPGDGDIPLRPVVRHLQDSGYRGAVSVEIMNPTLGQVPIAQLYDAAQGALERLLDSTKSTAS